MENDQPPGTETNFNPQKFSPNDSVSKSKDNLPVVKEPHVNSPQLTLAFKRSGFFDKNVVSEYDTQDSTFKIATEYEGDPIVPPTHKDITVERDLEISYNAKLKEMQSTSKNSCEYEETIMSLAEECNKLKTSIQAMKEKRNTAQSFVDLIQSARTKAQHAVKYWITIDPVEYGKWLCVLNATNRILSRVDEAREKANETIDVDKDISASGNQLSSDHESESNEVIVQNTLVEASDGRMVAVDGILPAGLKATPSSRFSRKIKGTTNKRSARDFVPVEKYTMYLNGGKGGKKRKLHKEGLQWIDGKIRCILCSSFIKQARCMEEHCATTKHIKSLKKN